MEDPETQEMRIEQVERERAEREHARDSDLPTEEHAALRRADKHAYLRSKLEERARSEEEG
jgi:hypothetical protein